MYFSAHICFPQQQALMAIVGIKWGFLTFTFLGVPLFKGSLKKVHLRPIANKILSHYESWKDHILSYVGRIYLIDSAITSSLVHIFSIYWWPFSLLKLMNYAMRDFLWSSSICVL